jgi:alpha-ketoglutarate-dependent taurine dioxygenase
MTELSIRNLHPDFGAEIRGIEPRPSLDADTVAQLRAVFDDRSVLVFPELDADATFQRYLVYTLLGLEPPVEHPEQQLRVQHVSNVHEDGAAPYGRLLFHCDNMFARAPQPAISLYGLKVEQPAAPTKFVAMGPAWDRLPESLKTRLEGLEARHGFDHRYPNRGADEDVIDAWFENSLSTVRPVPFRHPRTGRTLLYVAQQSTIEIMGLSPAENEELLEELFTHLYAPEHQLVHGWFQRDLVVWDNVAVQHARGPVALDGPERTLRKITGPISLDPDELEGLAPVHEKTARM